MRAGDSFNMYQGWYDKVLAVNPKNANDLLFGDYDVEHSTDGGTTWTNISQAPVYTHWDQHAIAFNPIDTTKIFAGNDGGLYKISYDEDSSGTPWQFFPLPITQFYSSAIDSANGAFAMGGTQDNTLYSDSGYIEKHLAKHYWRRCCNDGDESV